MFTLDFIYYKTKEAIATDPRYAFIAEKLNPAVRSNMLSCARSPVLVGYATQPQACEAGFSTLIVKTLSHVRLIP